MLFQVMHCMQELLTVIQEQALLRSKTCKIYEDLAEVCISIWKLLKKTAHIFWKITQSGYSKRFASYFNLQLYLFEKKMYEIFFEPFFKQIASYLCNSLIKHLFLQFKPYNDYHQSQNKNLLVSSLCEPYWNECKRGWFDLHYILTPCATLRVSHVEQDLLTLIEYLKLPSAFWRRKSCSSLLVFYVVFNVVCLLVFLSCYEFVSYFST